MTSNFRFVIGFSLPYLTSGVDSLLHLPSAEAVSAERNAHPQCNHKVTGSGYKAIDSCEAETSTKALVTCSSLLSQVWSALS